MRGGTKRYVGRQLVRLRPEYRERLIDLETERCAIGVDEEQFVADRLKRAQLTPLIGPKKTKAKDGGVDFAVVVDGRVIVVQVKWWKHPIGNKQVKAIYGEIHWSEVAIKARETGLQTTYILLAPFVSPNALQHAVEYSRDGYHLVWGERFVMFMSNPYYFLMNRLEVAN